MSISSFLIVPDAESKAEVLSDLQEHPCCEVLPSDEQEVFILLVDAEDDQERKQTMDFISQHPHIDNLMMVFGQVDEQYAQGE